MFLLCNGVLASVRSSCYFCVQADASVRSSCFSSVLPHVTLHDSCFFCGMELMILCGEFMIQLVDGLS